ncbi:unnamed protein product [Sphagnum jensenii]|uniref:Uncharacterized protein n=1 Tax=Sphagnum jensenii TaxID=128206 RepID=A0ABP0XDT6_9BRYO
MAFEHGHHNEVQVDQLATIADTYAQVEEQLATMRASVASQRHGPNRLIVEDADDLLQRDSDQDARVLTNDAVLGLLDGCRRLSK